jgi:phosphoribosylglycinamide formyltransferase-1|tara:strand:+ start:277 stop:489 length:213 start_codon:yes stop_codon:yes gene_type:complete
MRLAILVSGKGSILEAIFDSGIDISLVVADRECEAIKLALDRGLEAELIKRSDFVKNLTELHTRISWLRD